MSHFVCTLHIIISCKTKLQQVVTNYGFPREGKKKKGGEKKGKRDREKL